MFYRLVAEIWDDEDGVNYYAAQFFDETGDDAEILAHGVEEDIDGARRRIAEALKEVS